MKRLFGMFKAFSFGRAFLASALLTAALVSCDNFQGDEQNAAAISLPYVAGGSPAAAGSTVWVGKQTLSGTIEKQDGIFPAEFCSANEIAASSAAKTDGATDVSLPGATGQSFDGVSGSIFPTVPTTGLTYSVTATATINGGAVSSTGEVTASGSNLTYKIDLPYASGGTTWSVTIDAKSGDSVVLKKTQDIDVDSSAPASKAFELEYSTDSTDGTGSVSLKVNFDSTEVDSVDVYWNNSSEPDKYSTAGSFIFYNSESQTPGSYDIKIVFKKGTAVVYAIVEKVNVYANLISNMLVGSAPYIESGKINVTSECISALGSVADGGIYLGGTGLVSGAAASDAGSGTKFKPVATLRRAFEIANQLAAKDSANTYTITVQGDVTIGDDDDGDAVLNAGTKVLVKGTVTSYANYWSVDGRDAYSLTSNSSSAEFQYITFMNMTGITAAAGTMTMDNCWVMACSSDQDGVAGGVTVASGATFTSTQGLEIKDCVNSAKGGGGVYCAGTLNLTGTTIADCAADKTTSSNGLGGGIYIEGDNAKVTLDSCLIGQETATDAAASDYDHSSNYAANYGGGIYIASASSVKLNNTTVSYNCAPSGGGVYVAQNTLSLTKSKIEKNAAIGKSSISGSGGGIYLDNGTISFSGDSSTIACNQAVGNSSGGGGLYVSSSSGQSAALGGEYYKNSCVTSAGAVAGSGGAIYNACSSRLTIDDDVVIGASGKGNSANYGGGIYNGSDLLIGGATISGNTAADSGGGVYNTADHSVTFIAGTISANSALKGGGIYNAGKVFVIGTAVIGGSTAADGNKAKGTNCFGGGIYNYTSGFVYLGYRTADTPFEWTGCIGWNSSENWAGGVYTSGYFYMLSGSVIENTDKQSNSGIYSVDTKRIRLGGSAYIPPRADGGNCVHVKNSAVGAIEILSDLTADVPVAVIIPKEYNATTQILYAENTGLIEGNRAKFYIKDDDTTDNYYWAINSSGFLEQIPIIGTKPWPDTVGDIVFSDGSALLYNDGITLTDTQKAQAAAIIIDASKRLGVALTYQTKSLCKDTMREGENVHESSARSNDDGEPNCNYMKSLGDYNQENYPGYWYADNYSVPGFDSGWYVPARTELQALYDSMSIVNGAIDKIGTSSVKPVAADFHWSSTATADTAFYVWQKNMSDGSEKKSYKNKSCIVRPVRKF